MGDTEKTNRPMTKESKDLNSAIGKSIQFDGNIKGEENFLVAGTVEGSILLNGAVLTVAKSGLVRGDIIARVIVVEGEVRGEMRGKDIVEIASTGVVHGDIRAPRVKLHDGCKFKGLVDMDHKDATPTERSRASQPVPPAARGNKSMAPPQQAAILSAQKPSRSSV